MKTYLSIVLAIKILMTLILFVTPFLFFSQTKLEQLFNSKISGGLMVYRLYGLALLALTVGYASGLMQVLAGEFPFGIVTMGIVSNGGATFILSKNYRQIASKASLYVVAGISFALLLALAMTAFGARP
jgi:hypothetical protein